LFLFSHCQEFCTVRYKKQISRCRSRPRAASGVAGPQRDVRLNSHHRFWLFCNAEADGRQNSCSLSVRIHTPGEEI